MHNHGPDRKHVSHSLLVHFLIDGHNLAFVAYFLERTGDVQVADLHHVDAESASFVPLAALGIEL